MEKKLRQVTDSIHGTIYLSELESELISTPYFYRLHDIYQSSTVYMTFPSNRTKRYEHSLGTMALASRILFSAVTNAETKTRGILFDKLKKYFLDILEMVYNGGTCEHLYFGKNNDLIDDLFDTDSDTNVFDDFIGCIEESVKSGEFVDSALDYYQFYPMERMNSIEGNNTENIFLYRCLLQAVRIVALFHDVGHPPYSHIIENTLRELYLLVESDSTIEWIPEKVHKFKKCLAPFFSKDARRAFKCDRLLSKSSLISAEPHERIGLGLLSYAVDDVIPYKIFDIADKSIPKCQRLAYVLYYITVVEFTFAILTEKDIFFKSFHKIVDGVLDADRLDYIVRDSQNSGVDWGKIPYERIINSAKLYYLEKNNNGINLAEDERPFVLAYPQKITDDIDDLILVRYKIFARINFHHRCMKTAMALQASVKELTINYLTNPQEECVNPDIKVLWEALNTRMGNKKIRSIQWNDSWLISVLHKSLVNLRTEFKGKNILLKENLEEILLNKKKYYTLMKRGVDNCNFTKMIMSKAGISEEIVNKILDSEYKKYTDSNGGMVHFKKLLSDPSCDALDSIGRLSDIFESFDLEDLCKFIPLDGNTLNEIVSLSLKRCTKLTNSVAIINYGRAKNGLPKHRDLLDGIYFYKNNICALYDENYSLSNQIEAITKNIPWLYVYFIPKEKCVDLFKLKEELLDMLATEVGEKLKIRFDELFATKISTE